MLNRLRQSSGALSFGLAAAGVAALVAHYAIDAIGDVALARDAYDGLAHGSRGLATLCLGLGVTGLALRFAIAALEGSAGRDRISRSLVVPFSPAWFVAAVVLGAVALLVGMESLDALAATGDLESFVDLLGGSPALGLGVVLPLAALLGCAAWSALTWLARCHDALLRAIGAIFAVLLPVVRPTARISARPDVRVAQPAVLLRRAAKRGPPAFLFA